MDTNVSFSPYLCGLDPTFYTNLYSRCLKIEGSDVAEGVFHHDNQDNDKLTSRGVEYVSLVNMICEVKYLRDLAHGLGFEETENTMIYEDNHELGKPWNIHCNVVVDRGHSSALC